MPSELRFVLILLGTAIVAGAVSTFGIYHQDSAQARIQAEAMTGGSAKAGRIAIGRYGCGACHVIPGISGSTGQAGPALNGIAVRAQIAGVLTNTPDAMIRWLRHPQQVLPGNGMPDQGIGDRDARDIAAYLYTVRK